MPTAESHKLLGELSNGDALLLHTPESVEINTEVTTIDRKSRTVKILNKKTTIAGQVPYNSMIPAHGAEPWRPQLQRMDAKQFSCVYILLSVDGYESRGLFSDFIRRSYEGHTKVIRRHASDLPVFFWIGTIYGAPLLGR